MASGAGDVNKELISLCCCLVGDFPRFLTADAWWRVGGWLPLHGIPALLLVAPPPNNHCTFLC